MGLAEILLNQNSRTFVDALFFGNDSDSTATARRCGLEYVHVLVVVHLSFVAESLVVLREQISVGTNLEVLSVAPSLPLHISPQVALVTDVPSSSKMVNLLKLVHIFQFAGPDQTCP
jgi:hypothetical protein